MRISTLRKHVQSKYGFDVPILEGNAKLGPEIGAFSLPAGGPEYGGTCTETCRFDGKICYAVRDQERQPSVRLSRERSLYAMDQEDFIEAFNYILRNATVRSVKRDANGAPMRYQTGAKAGQLMLTNEHKPLTMFRFNVSGDYDQRRFDTACEIARQNPNITFYMYTKNVLDLSAKPDNLIVNWSIREYNAPLPVLREIIAWAKARGYNGIYSVQDGMATCPCGRGENVLCQDCKQCQDPTFHHHTTCAH
jgi:hypothetical protein